FRDREFDLEYDVVLGLNRYQRGGLTFGKREALRVTKTFDDPRFFPRGGAFKPNSITQGSLGDSYFLSALATVSSNPGHIAKICDA
ncbi:hypothetical protein BKA70DRAFT_1043673, partial [Coprinopsis sp. MPI-PUGE-AT-0042]